MPSNPEPAGQITSRAVILDLNPAPIPEGYLRCLFGSQVTYPTTCNVGGNSADYGMRELVALAPGTYTLTFKTVDGIPAPPPLEVQIVSDRLTVVLVSYDDPARPQKTSADFPPAEYEDPFEVTIVH